MLNKRVFEDVETDDFTMEEITLPQVNTSRTLVGNPAVKNEGKPAAKNESKPAIKNDVNQETLKDMIVGNDSPKYRLLHKIGSGSFGDVYLAQNIFNGEEVAVKMESQMCKQPQLLYECKLYRHLQGGIGIPRLRWYGTHETGYNVMVTDLLGPSLEDLFNSCGRRFSLKTVLMVADQMLGRLEYMHNKNYVHRDIKPENFLLGLGRHCNKLHLIDFGLSKRYRDSRTRVHIPEVRGKSLTGTARYASINAHLGTEQSRRDDLESLGYVLLYFLNGSLPWQGLKGHGKQKYEKICENKLTLTAEYLGKNQPEEFTSYLNYVRGLRFEEVPDYDYIRKQLFRNLFRKKKHYNYDFVFDWNQKDQIGLIRSDTDVSLPAVLTINGIKKKR